MNNTLASALRPAASMTQWIGVLLFCVGTGALAALALPHAEDRTAIFSSMGICWVALAQLLSGRWRLMGLPLRQLTQQAREAQLHSKVSWPVRVLQIGAWVWFGLFVAALMAVA